MHKIHRGWLLGLSLVLLGGCASNVPQVIRQDAAEPLSVAQAQASPEALRGESVRWGGEILEVLNRKQYTDVVVLRRRLFNDGEPRPDGGEAKRFVARVAGFLEPAEYAPEKRLTVVGELAGLLNLTVGDFEYPHPVVRVEVLHLWPKYEPPPDPGWYRDPFFCDPFWPRYRFPYCW